MTKLEFLRQIVANLAISDPPASPQGVDWLRSLGFFVAWLQPWHIFGIKLEGAQPFAELVEQLQTESHQYERGSTFETFAATVAQVIASEFLGREPETINDEDVTLVEEQVATWFRNTALLHRHYIPCTIISDESKPIDVGPVSFAYWNDFVARERAVIPHFDFAFKNIYESMRHENAFWIAALDVDDCENQRSSEIADLTVDIALVGIQLVVPLPYSERMARLTARTLPRNRESVCLVGGAVSTGGKNQQAGLGISGGAFAQYLDEASRILESVGRRVAAYLADKGALPNLQQAWCDGAYWFHEGLAEPLDAIAVPKLETAIEVLMRAESTSGSERRLLNAMKAFFGLQADQIISSTPPTTVKEFVKGFVRDRSRILHGTWSTLRTSLRTNRTSLTAIARQLLSEYTIALDGYAADSTSRDDIAAFLTWVDLRRSAGAAVCR